MVSMNVLVGAGIAILVVALVSFIAPFVFAIMYGPADQIGGSLGVNNTTAWTSLDTAIAGTSTMFATGTLGLIGLALLGVLLAFLGISKLGGKK